ncbi:zinc finger CCCH domain-containing protein 33-like [Zingiber officinale]|uniref:C3H1-type domain-containing protein n=1 Tax=Zingiber officinale TaxID=94328 RepID=A0A8J5I9Y6_ZINOF|nr:zinc finger CCCH domain-containing protein 33-like [Zingiber officinale]KAG6531615.1 hypothetical protein ZIOFF_005431 [Zingiber officinale]
MCPGHRRSSSPPTGTVCDARSPSLEKAALLLELAASDDLSTFKRAVEDAGLPLDVAAPWYCRSSDGVMGYQLRTPTMIAALYGSTSVMGYILSARPAESARCAATDGATALHCAAAGGSAASLEVAKLLIAASPDVIDAVDTSGNRPGDIVARQLSNSVFKSLEVLLRSPACPRVSSPNKEVAKVSEKKEYPQSPDLVLPDINSGIYVTDEFRMYAFKIKPCSRAYSHDWTECPFAHPGENARRRDPRKHSYSCVPCPEFRKGTCRNGDACEYAHGVFESWLHPAQYRTRLCKDETGCNRRVCFFAHKVDELRTVNPSAASMTGTALPSPGSSPPSGVSSMDMVTALLLMQQSGSPASSQTGSVASPQPLQLPSSRLRASKSARNMEVDLGVLGSEGYQKKLIDDARRTNSLAAAVAAAGATDYNHLLGSVDPSLLNKLQGLSVRSMQQSQLLSSYGGSSSAAPTSTATSSFGLDNSMAKAIMDSRASAFAKRSLSFCDRGATAGRQSTLSAMTMTAIPPPPPPAESDWSSPYGKLDWSIQGEELNKLRKSATFAYRNNQAMHGGISSASGSKEPDVSWVNSLVKDGPAVAPVGRMGAGKQQNGYPVRDGGNSHGSEFFYPWVGDKIMA